MTPEELALLDGPWSNNACCGYVLIALKGAGKSPEEINEIMRLLYSSFEDYTTEDAKKIYEASQY